MTVFNVLREEKLYAKLSECHFMTQDVDYLYHVMTPTGIKIDRRMVEAVTDWPTPAAVRAIESFVGLCNYYS